MGLEEENQLLRATLDALSHNNHVLALNHDKFLRWLTEEQQKTKALRKEVTRHNKRCRGRKKQVKLLLSKLNEARQRLKSCAAGFCESTGL